MTSPAITHTTPSLITSNQIALATLTHLDLLQLLLFRLNLLLDRPSLLFNTAGVIFIVLSLTRRINFLLSSSYLVLNWNKRRPSKHIYKRTSASATNACAFSTVFFAVS